MKLLTSQKDSLYDLIEEFGLSPLQFSFLESPSSIGSIDLATNLIYNNQKFYFSFESHPNRTETHYSIFCPGTNTFEEKMYTGDWQSQLKYFRLWLRNLKRELETPNKWDRLMFEAQNLSLNDNSSVRENKFSIDEFEDLKNKVKLLKGNINALELETSQIQAINSKLDHLIEMAKTLSKFDWRSLFIGTVMSIVIQLNVTPENATALWSLIKSTFNNLFLQ